MEFRPYRRKLEVLTRIAQRAGSGTVTDDIRRLQVSDFAQLLYADRGTLYLLDDHKNELWSKVVVDSFEMTIRVKVGQGLAGWVAMAGIPLVINDVLADDRFDGRWDKKSGYRTHTVLAAPMLDLGNRVIGVLQVLNSEKGAFDQGDQHLLEVVAAICSLAEQATAAQRVVV